MHDVAPDEERAAHDKVDRMEYHVRKLQKEVGAHGNRPPQEERICMQSAGFWRTIILSSLGKTLFPYSQYIRRLNLGNLEELLTDSNFPARISENFFQGELAQFDNGLGVLDTINRIGEAITKQTPLLEELTGKIRGRELFQWIRRLPRLTHLKLCLGEALLNHACCINRYCPSFERLDLWDWDYRSVNLNREVLPLDFNLAAFLNLLRPQSLESFGAFNNHYVGTNSFQALSASHGKSLVELRLNNLPSLTIQELWLLKDCTNLVSLSLAGRALCVIPVQIFHWGALLKTVAWLKECKKLRILSVTNMLSAHALTAPILLENDIHLISLEYQGGDGFPESEMFYKALPNCTSLQYLDLKEDNEMKEEEADRVVESLSKLVNLTDLCLGEESYLLTDRQVARLARSLPKLKNWSTDGYELTDAIWSPLASLRSLRRVHLGVYSNFTAYGMLDFLEKLGPGNKGLVITVMYEDPDNSGFSLRVQELIREEIAKKVEGSFCPGRTTELDSDDITIEFDSDESESESDQTL
ncbi:hypothetical protein MMC22_007757 [Lobaria immixta]|nr:hypothetical protein [Lobaria immixta]